MRKLISFVITVLGLVALLCTSRANAQTTVNSDGVSVRNSAPANVFFMFPVGTDNNITEIQFGCSDSPVNRNWVFVYEEQPNGSIVTYPIQTEVACNEAYGSGFTTFTGSLKNDITVNTPDHTITISSATAWTAAKKSGLHGYYWAATGGSSTITVQ